MFNSKNHNAAGKFNRSLKPYRTYFTDHIVGIILTFIIIILLPSVSRAQNIGVNNPAPHNKALLDLTSNDKGLLAPRMTQLQRTAMFPVADATAKGMLVYQTDLQKGFYYYDGASWQYINPANSDWSVAGNAGTNASTNFIGTTDVNDFVIKTNNAERMRIKSTGEAGINITPLPGISLSANAGINTGNIGIYARANANNTYAITAVNLSPTNLYPTLSSQTWADNGTAISGQTNSSSGYGVAINGNAGGANGTGIYGAANNTTGVNYGVRGESLNPNGYAGFFNGRGYFSSYNGFGTLNPAASVHINGSFILQNGTQNAGKVLTSDATGLASWEYMNADNVSAWGMNGNSGTNASTNFIGTTDANDLVFKTNNTEKMRMDCSGQIGINTAPNADFKLNVSNTVNGAISGTTNSNNLYLAGVVGSNTAASGNASGVYGQTASNMGYGVFGYATASNGANSGVYGQSGSSSGCGVTGVNSSASGTTYGVYGSVTSPNGYSGYFGGGIFSVTGNSGFGTANPNTQMDINGAIALREDATIIATAPVTTLSVGNRSYYRISSNAIASSRIISLSNGLQTGQMVIIESSATGINGIRIADNAGTNNTNTPIDRDLNHDDVITMLWNGTDWIELNYVNN